ncbi:MAG TPA: hypothetical protein VFB43_14935 [Terracidiphilus sp.]|nr:hypothetical protein [Terracidiphilus sp.]
MHLNRRSFLQLCSAATAFLTREARPQSKAAAPAAQSRGPAKHREPFVAIQVKPFSWVDEGVDQVLDNLQQKGNVNTIFAYTFDYEESRLRKDGPVPLPDHGVSGGELVGGAFYDYDPKYFQATSLKDFRSKDYGKFDVIAEVAPKAHARGMDFFAWDYNNADPIMARSIPGISYVAEIDVYGRRTTSPCFNHPDYRTFLTGKIESVLSGYSSEVDGLTWGCERMGPINNMIGGGWTTKGICCFCEFCRTKARERGISVERATTGYRKLDQLFTAAAQDQRPTDGYFVSFWRLLLEYPEILSWETLWTGSYHEVRSQLYGTGKALAPEKPFGFHIQQNMTFSPFYRAEEDYAETRHYADFLKLATYNNAGGPRMASFLDRLSATIFHDATPDNFLPLYYKMMGDEGEASYSQLHIAGLSASYVARETKRALAGVEEKIKIYPSIDIDIPTKPDDHRTKPDDVREAIRAAFGAGANGVVLATRYEEMWLANLSAAGETLRAVFQQGG